MGDVKIRIQLKCFVNFGDKRVILSSYQRIHKRAPFNRSRATAYDIHGNTQAVIFIKTLDLRLITQCHAY
eukprot:Awhi_evm1s7333